MAFRKDARRMSVIIMKKSLYARCRRFSTFVGLTGCLIGAVAAAQAAAEPPPQSAAPAAEAKADVAGKSVVKIVSTLRYPDRFQPWSKKAPVSASASGVVIEGKRILTTAHAVAYASDVQIEVNEAGDKVAATVAGFSPEIDLAVLKLDDEAFFNTHPPLKRGGKLPQIKDAVTAYGFAEGASGVSTTKGIVSRIDFAAYSIGSRGLRIQVDTPLSPGISGGPAVVGDTMIGLAFAPSGKTEKFTYINPGLTTSRPAFLPWRR